ncbi:MAG: hypothetical protein IJ706_07390 [Clostridia bacterium]|nr:hypothetical protein [Clostridia bacterium]
MDYIFLLISVICGATTSILAGFYDKKTSGIGGDNSAVYNLILTATVMLCWCVSSLVEMSFTASVLPYSLGTGAFFACAMIGTTLAVKYGPVSLTSLFSQISLIGVSVYGIIFWNAPLNVWAITGIAAVILSIVLCFSGKEKEGNEKKINAKWLIFAAMSFVGNAGCSIIVKQQQLDFGGTNGSCAMFFALSFALIITAVVFIFSDKSGCKAAIKRAGYFPVAAGAGNFGLNFFVVLLATSSLSSNVVYPVIAVGGLAISMLASVLIFKEKLNVFRWLGIAIGAAATAVLSIGA